jgi:polyribonucleotide nucleotidyltransferase
MIHKVELEINDRNLIIESGRVAQQARGSVTVRYADTVILATVVVSDEPRDQDWFPLFVEYRQKAYAAGKIPGGFFKREGRPGEKEVLSARLVDRPIRPLFPKGYMNEVQIIISVLSADQENDADILGMIGASAALYLSGCPFQGPIGAVRMGRLGGEYVVNPTFSQLENSDLDIVIAGTKESITMIEGRAKEVPEEDLLGAIEVSRSILDKVIQLQEDLVSLCGKPKMSVEIPPPDEELVAAVTALASEELSRINTIAIKEERQKALASLVESAIGNLSERFPERQKEITEAFQELERADVRRKIIENEQRIDGRKVDEIRPISCEVSFLPRTHGSALFTRGQTQSLAVTTLGTKMDEQKIDALEGESWKSYMLHYNFPPFSVGEVRPIRGPGRREIGHGALAERAIEPVIPADEVFPYTIRIVSDILESNGSSSMATVCAGSLSLMDAGVPVKAAVAGVAVGLVKEGDKVVLLSDILGIEDHLGDMDMKVTGSRAGITAVQMDLKISGVSLELLGQAFERARRGRMAILDIMDETISSPRDELSEYAPRILTLQIDPEKIGDVIGPGGKVIRKITEDTGAQIDIDDDGTITVASVDSEGGQRALEIIKQLTADVEIGQVYTGKVKKITGFGAFVEILPGKEGLVHISQLERHRVARVEDVVNLGDEIQVKVLDIDDAGKIRLSRRALLGGGGEEPKPGVHRRSLFRHKPKPKPRR